MNDAAELLVSAIDELCRVSKTAHNNAKPLSGHGFYGNKFHSTVIEFAAIEAKLFGLLAQTQCDATKVQELKDFLAQIKNPATLHKARVDTAKKAQLLVHTVVIPALQAPPAHPTPTTEKVLPLSVVAPANRGYLKSIVTQANTCYEHRCFDACSVMIRRLVETLLIDMYEAKGKQADITSARTGHYHMLAELIDIALKDSTWGFSRDTKQSLPAIKQLGDRSAHNRRYLATKQDVDNVLSGLRVVVDDLLHLAGLK
jgi:hypothetical protein